MEDPIVFLVETAKKELKKDRKKHIEIESLLSKNQFPDDPNWAKEDEIGRLKILLSAYKNITLWYRVLFKD